MSSSISASELASFNATIKDYTASVLVKFIHEDMPRKNRHIQTVSNNFDPQNMMYLESIVLVAFPAILLAVLTVLFFLFRGIVHICQACLISCGYMKQKKRKINNRPRIVLWTIVVSALIVAGGIGYGLSANQDISAGIGKVQKALVDMNDLKNVQVTSARDVLDNLNQILNSTHDLYGMLVVLNETIPVSVFEFGYILDIQKQMNSATGPIGTAIDRYQNLPIEGIVKKIKQYDSYRWEVQLGVLCIQSVPFVMVLFAVMCMGPTFLWHVVWIGVVCVLLGWLLTGVETSGLTVMSDACIDPSGFLLNRTSGNIRKYVEFFVVCKNIPSPFESQLTGVTDAVDASKSAVASLGSYVSSLEQYTHTNVTEFPAINTTMNSIADNVTGLVTDVNILLESAFKCNRIHNNYIDTLEGICTRTFGGFFALVIIQGGITALTWIAILCGIRLYHFLRKRKLKRQQNKSNRSYRQASIIDIMFNKNNKGGGEHSDDERNDANKNDRKSTGSNDRRTSNANNNPDQRRSSNTASNDRRASNNNGKGQQHNNDDQGTTNEDSQHHVAVAVPAENGGGDGFENDFRLNKNNRMSHSGNNDDDSGRQSNNLNHEELINRHRNSVSADSQRPSIYGGVSNQRNRGSVDSSAGIEMNVRRPSTQPAANGQPRAKPIIMFGNQQQQHQPPPPQSP
eukprot:c8532_g1_i1.p1 GENE.c8532_g1_i1~~c8532_g1_i1.p1  ORF type:complete len:683 (-),score=166.64 c8532_g1_i1:33-2081(-)